MFLDIRVCSLNKLSALCATLMNQQLQHPFTAHLMPADAELVWQHKRRISLTDGDRAFASDIARLKRRRREGGWLTGVLTKPRNQPCRVRQTMTNIVQPILMLPSKHVLVHARRRSSARNVFQEIPSGVGDVLDTCHHA